MAATGMPFSPIGYVEDQDLRKITNHRGVMRRHARKYNLKALQSVIFVNKKTDLIRIIYMDGFGGLHLDLPEKDVGAKRLSTILRVSISLAKLARGGIKKAINDGLIPKIEAKEERSKKYRAARKRNSK
jgi:hypothetical protein